jgi:signal transduction histidine kinase
MTLSNNIARKVRNHLATIIMYAEISESELKDMMNRIKEASYLLSNLQSQIKGTVSGEFGTKDFKPCSIASDIEKMLEQYPFGACERKLINLNLEKLSDFEYMGNSVLTVHVLYNLMKNSLCSIQAAGKGKITITLESDSEFNKLIFEDTGMGIPEDLFPKIFNLFSGQTGFHGDSCIGLTFCKTVVESYGGSIVCESVYKDYTKFVLKFPKNITSIV